LVYSVVVIIYIKYKEKSRRGNINAYPLKRFPFPGVINWEGERDER
jgi:hypothetical protein